MKEKQTIKPAQRNQTLVPEQPVKQSEKKPEQVVYSIVSDESNCDQCHEEIFRGEFLQKKQDKALCKQCSDFKEFVFLPAGHAKLTRIAKRYSNTYAIVVRFSRARKRYERRGLLIEEQALNQAQKELGIEKLEDVFNIP